MLPKPTKKNTYVAGFGYVSSTREYKVIGIHRKFKREFARVYVYTLGSLKGWRNLGKFTSEFSVLCEWDGPGIFANGALYWLESELKYILTFDLAEEKFCKHLSLPPLPDSWCYYEISLLNGFLYFVLGPHDEEDVLNDVWLLKTKIDNHDMEVRYERQSMGWSKELKDDSYNLLAITKCGGVLIYGGHYLNIHDTKSSTLKWLVKFKKWIGNVHPHKNSLVSLNELGEEDIKMMESVGIKGTRSRKKYIFL